MYFDALDIAHHKSQIIQESHYYPYGLTFQVHNIPDQVKNKTRFQGQERDDLTGWDQFKWCYRLRRNHQPELGRFFNIDPLSEEYVHNATYAFSENHVTSGIELEGLEDVRLNLEQDRDVNDYLSGKITAQQKREREVARVQGAAAGLAVGSLFVGGAAVGAPRLASAARTGWGYYMRNPIRNSAVGEQAIEVAAGAIEPDAPDQVPMSLADDVGRAAGRLGRKVVKEVGEKATKKVDDLLNTLSDVKNLKNGVVQGTIKGNGEELFNSLTEGAELTKNSAFKLKDGTILHAHKSKTTGEYTISVNRGGEKYKIRVNQE